jgi:RNA polymerase sigma-70 factor (ECF subfamily)
MAAEVEAREAEAREEASADAERPGRARSDRCEHDQGRYKSSFAHYATSRDSPAASTLQDPCLGLVELKGARLVAVAPQLIGYVAQLRREIPVIELAHAHLYERVERFPTGTRNNSSTTLGRPRLATCSAEVALGFTGRGAPLRHQDFERLYAAHAQPLLAFLVYRTGDPALAEDLLGDTFERVLRGRGPFDPRRGAEKTWVYAIALNCLRDHARRRSAEQRALERTAATVPPEDWPSARLDALLERDVVHRSLEVLSDDERLAVALRFGADMTMPEIAKLVRQPLTTVEARIYRALRKLRPQLEPS